MALKVKYRKAPVPTTMRITSYHGMKFAFCSPFFAGNIRYPRKTMHAIKEVSLTSSRKVPQRVTYMQNSENAMSSASTTSLGVPSQTRVFDSRSNFFITSSTADWIFSLSLSGFTVSVTAFLVLFSSLLKLIVI